MRCLVTGATGFLGRRLVVRLLHEGWEVRGVSRSTKSPCLMNHKNLTWIIRDLSEEGLLFEEMEGVHTLFHLAGFWRGDDERDLIQSNEMSTVNILRKLPSHVRKVVFTSSQMVYGDPNHLGVTEGFSLDGSHTAYACSKLNSENWVRWFQKKNGGCYIVLRFTGFIEGGGLVDYIIDRAIKNESIELFSNGLICRDYLSIENGVDALLKAGQCSFTEDYHCVNIGSGQAVTSIELAKMICAEIRSQSKIVLINKEGSRSNFVFDVSKAKRSLEFIPGVLADLVRNYVRELRTQNKND